MSNQELRKIRQRIKFDMRSFAACLGIPHTTLQRYEDGSAAIPANIERAAQELEQVEREFDVARLSAFDARLVREYPHGIRSDI